MCPDVMHENDHNYLNNGLIQGFQLNPQMTSTKLTKTTCSTNLIQPIAKVFVICTLIWCSPLTLSTISKFASQLLKMMNTWVSVFSLLYSFHCYNESPNYCHQWMGLSYAYWWNGQLSLCIEIIISYLFACIIEKKWFGIAFCLLLS